MKTEDIVSRIAAIEKELKKRRAENKLLLYNKGAKKHKKQIGLPQPGKIVITKIVHIIRRMIQRGNPAAYYIGKTYFLYRYAEPVRHNVRVHQKPKCTEGNAPYHASIAAEKI